MVYLFQDYESSGFPGGSDGGREGGGDLANLLLLEKGLTTMSPTTSELPVSTGGTTELPFSAGRSDFLLTVVTTLFLLAGGTTLLVLLVGGIALLALDAFVGSPIFLVTGGTIGLGGSVVLLLVPRPL